MKKWVIILLISLVTFAIGIVVYSQVQLFCHDPLVERDGICQCESGYWKQTADDGTITCQYLGNPDIPRGGPGGNVPDIDCKKFPELCDLGNDPDFPEK